jgi:pimeloyl-ACP methyl ester carboxylesterase
MVPGFEEFPQPAAPPEAGRVILFTGLNWSGESHRATGTDALAQEVRRAGVPSYVYRPGEWARATQDVLALKSGPIFLAVYGYSAGGPAATRFAKRLEEAGVQVDTMVVLESWHAAQVPCNVGYAIQYRLDEGSRLAPAHPGCTDVANSLIDAELAPHSAGLNHLSVAADATVMRIMLEHLVTGSQGGRHGSVPPGP